MRLFWNYLAACTLGSCLTALFFQDWRNALGFALLTTAFVIVSGED